MDTTATTTTQEATTMNVTHDNMTEATPEDLRAAAARKDQDAQDSYERCDTDGFVSQWASGLTARLYRRQAEITEQGGAWFPALFDLDGNWVPAKLIDGKYGTCWALVGEDNRFTGEFVSAFPAKASTMARKGYIEGQAKWPAKAKIMGGGQGLSGAATCYVGQIKLVDNDLQAPIDTDPTPTNPKA